jgi:amino-acid N-acetyltransferase
MTRKARPDDCEAVMAIVNAFAARGLMLPRTLDEVRGRLNDFLVCEADGRVVGCAALQLSDKGLGEIRSLAVLQEAQGRGVGAELVRGCLDEARRRGMSRVFALTYVREFFRRLGFRDYAKEDLPSKIWSDCFKCPKRDHCDEEAVIIELDEPVQ